MASWSRFILIIAALVASHFVLRGTIAFGQEPDRRVRFNRDVRPILSDTCFKCHGFDEKERKAGLRLDTREGLTRTHKNVTPIAPGDLSKSEVYRRIVSEDPDELMPPVKSGKKLTPEQKDVI